MWWVGLAAGGGNVRAEPANLQPHKEEIRRYVRSGEYLREVSAVAEAAKQWIRERAAEQKTGVAGGRLAVVFDLDETLLDNTAHMLDQDFGYVPAVWSAWVEAGRAPAFAPVREVYELARELKVAVIFMTGRTEAERAATVKNLRAIGCDDYAELVMRPDDATGTNGAVKLAQRRALGARGYRIIANLGDQESDFEGGAAERNFKLPNPFYITK